ncbi:hypothetical protein Nepgr_031543 [Nepenthes gracilis]|uniref:Uncharacterized protein n=1 Tax=Nepenthes gracilis TaxID=150966 RepID=A0AAD3Y6Y3_NEPGR|nr:hypothetical protein Nepgr_031543 [Nepenthes gracilis]
MRICIVQKLRCERAAIAASVLHGMWFASQPQCSVSPLEGFGPGCLVIQFNCVEFEMIENFLGFTPAVSFCFTWLLWAW